MRGLCSSHLEYESVAKSVNTALKVLAPKTARNFSST